VPALRRALRRVRPWRSAAGSGTARGAVPGEVRLDLEIRETSDAGRPLVVSEPNGPQVAVYREIAKNVWTELGKTRGSDRAAPRIVIEA
jgi:hypothetical protein